MAPKAAVTKKAPQRLLVRGLGRKRRARKGEKIKRRRLRRLWTPRKKVSASLTSVHFYRPSTLKLPRAPKYPRKSTYLLANNKSPLPLQHRAHLPSFQRLSITGRHAFSSPFKNALMHMTT
uniref:Ribosomal protein L23/L25 N-terminal domain-containing protein n=1 Tax=Globodera rostochiensis TaxID=31243 RepID=A0A914IAI3_GLORO